MKNKKETKHITLAIKFISKFSIFKTVIKPFKVVFIVSNAKLYKNEKSTARRDMYNAVEGLFFLTEL